VTRPRAADDFAMIRARMEELRRERAKAQVSAGSADDLMIGPMRSHRAMAREIEPEDQRLVPRVPVRRLLG